MASLRPVSVSRPAWQRSLAALAAVSVLAGCASTATPTPAVQVPTQWQHARSTTPGQMLPDRWWQAFGDARLNQLVELALQRNTNLAQAAYKVRNAQLQAGNAAGNRLPTPSASVNTSGSRPLDGDGGTNRNYSVSLGVSWEADLWGKLATQQRMADWEAVATEQDRQAAAHALVATVAKTWWQLAVAENKLASQRQSLARANKTLQLAEVQYRAGAISGLDLAQARQSQASQQAAIHSWSNRAPSCAMRWPSCSMRLRASCHPGPSHRACPIWRACPRCRPACPPNCWVAGPTCRPPSCACAPRWPTSMPCARATTPRSASPAVWVAAAMRCRSC